MSGDVEIPLEWVASAFGLTPEATLEAMRAGRITSVVENGVGEDEGRRRLTFFNGSRRARIVLDAEGRPVQRSSVDFGAADGAMRRAGGPPRR